MLFFPLDLNPDNNWCVHVVYFSCYVLLFLYSHPVRSLMFIMFHRQYIGTVPKTSVPEQINVLNVLYQSKFYQECSKKNANPMLSLL